MIYFPIQFIHSLGLVRMVFNSSFNLNIQFFVTCFYDFISFKKQISLWVLFFRSPDLWVPENTQKFLTWKDEEGESCVATHKAMLTNNQWSQLGDKNFQDWMLVRKKFHGCRTLALDLKVGKPFFLLVHAQSFNDYKLSGARYWLFSSL